MPDQRLRELSVRRKLNAMTTVFKDKCVLLVDDSIVRGTTMTQIVNMVRLPLLYASRLWRRSIASAIELTRLGSSADIRTRPDLTDTPLLCGSRTTGGSQNKSVPCEP